jgi:hypothetical protein
MKSQISKTITLWTFAAFVSFGVGTGLAGQSLTDAAPGQSPAPSPTAEPSPDQSDSRVEELKARRRAQGGKSRTSELSGLERALAEMEKTRFHKILDLNYKGLYPQFASLSTGSGFAPGATCRRPAPIHCVAINATIWSSAEFRSGEARSASRGSGLVRPRSLTRSSRRNQVSSCMGI